MAKQAPGCGVLRLLKASAGVLEVLRVLRPAQNVSWSSLKPNRNSL